MTDTREEFGRLLSLYDGVLIAAAAVVFAVVLFALVRYRRREGRVSSGRSDAPVVESLYALTLALVAAVLVAFTFRAEERVTRVVGDPGLRIDVTAFKWQWRFAYPGKGVRPVVGSEGAPARLVVPADTTIRFTLTSRDVIHSFWVPETRFKRDAFPKRTTQFDLVFSERGAFTGRCAEFCGLRHADMTFTVEVLSPASFRSWLAQRRMRSRAQARGAGQP
jgi:cytochrome c oxidase subunit 2